MNNFWGRPGGGAPVIKDQSLLSRKHSGNISFLSILGKKSNGNDYVITDFFSSAKQINNI